MVKIKSRFYKELKELAYLALMEDGYTHRQAQGIYKNFIYSEFYDDECTLMEFVEGVEINLFGFDGGGNPKYKE